MSTDRFFFLLREPLSADNVTKLMGRVVAHKFDPLDSFAPGFQSSSSPNNNADPAYIIPSILPVPTVKTDLSREVRLKGDRPFKLSLSNLFGVDLGHVKSQSAKLESDEVKTYKLTNPADIFDELMDNTAYASTIEKFMRTSPKHHAYFVTGFMTTSNTVWTKDSTTTDKVGGNLTFPLAAGGVPLPFGIADPSIEGSFSDSVFTTGSYKVEGEQIFAVKYHVIKAHLRFNNQSKTIEKKVRIGPAKRANAKELALGKDEQQQTSDAISEEPALDLFLADEHEEEYESDVGVD